MLISSEEMGGYRKLESSFIPDDHLIFMNWHVTLCGT